MDARELRLQLEEKRMPNKMLQRDKDWLSKMLSEHLELQVGQESKDLQRIHHRILGSNPPEQPGGSVGSTRQPGTEGCRASWFELWSNGRRWNFPYKRFTFSKARFSWSCLCTSWAVTWNTTRLWRTLCDWPRGATLLGQRFGKAARHRKGPGGTPRRMPSDWCYGCLGGHRQTYQRASHLHALGGREQRGWDTSQIPLKIRGKRTEAERRHTFALEWFLCFYAAYHSPTCIIYFGRDHEGSQPGR